MLRKLAAMAASSLAALTFASAAFAEGSWTSYISGALTGFESRIWYDGNTDAANTLIRFDGCHLTWGPGTNADVNLRRVINNWPDDDRGTKRLYCSTSDTGNWGDVPGGDYRFRIDKIGGQTSGNQLNVDYVRVSY